MIPTIDAILLDACTAYAYSLCMVRPSIDVMIAGAGPAGLAAAAACVGAGLSTVLVAPEPDAAWPNGYGAWVDEIVDPVLANCQFARWNAVEVRFGIGDANPIQRAYQRVDNVALREALLSRCGGMTALRTSVRGVTHDAAGSTVDTDHGPLRAAVIVDATGPGSALVDRAGVATRFQTAWGELVDTDDLDPAVPRFMDFTPAAGAHEPPTFLYALPLGGTRWLVEETSLVRAPALSWETLRARLQARLARNGICVRAVHGVERVRIPMDAPVPAPQRTVAFGAAAAMVHPSTGFSLARSLATAPALGESIARGLADSPAAAARAAWDVVWPTTRRRQRALHLYGAEVLSGLDQADTTAFFRAFFALPPETVRDWLADRLPPERLAMAMARMFPHLPARLRWKAASSGRLHHLLSAALP